MEWLLLLASLAAGPLNAWAAPSTDVILPLDEPGSQADASIRLYAARGEFESFQIAVHASRRPLTVTGIAAAPLAPEIPPPRVFAVEYVDQLQPHPRAPDAASLIPDVLAPLETPLAIREGETAVFWITYEIPAFAEPGIHDAILKVQYEEAPSDEIAVTVEVFDAVIPEVPAVRMLFELDPAYLPRTEDQQIPRDVLATLGRYKIGHYLAAWPWEVGDTSASEPVAGMQEHVSRAMAAGPMAVIALHPAPASIGNGPQAHAAYLASMQEWLTARGWQSYALAGPLPLERQWSLQQLRESARGIRAAAPGLPRLVPMHLHPALERHAEVFATPLTLYDRGAHAQVLDGLSLVTWPPLPVEHVTATSSDWSRAGRGISARVQHAVDGSIFTAWRSSSAPSRDGPETLALAFEHDLRTDAMRLLWEPGHEGTDIRVETTFDGTWWMGADVDWEHAFARSPRESSISTGVFRVKKEFIGLRLILRDSRLGAPVGIREVQFAPFERPAGFVQGQVAPPEVWLRPIPESFPSIATGVSPGEIRSIAWVCFGMRLPGIFGPRLNPWPDAWSDPDAARPFYLAGEAYTGLFYPGGEGLLPSIRAAHLRDAVEDYALLEAAAKGLRQGMPGPESVFEMLAPSVYRADWEPEAVQEQTEVWLERRVRLGRLLTDWAGDGWYPNLDEKEDATE